MTCQAGLFLACVYLFTSFQGFHSNCLSSFVLLMPELVEVESARGWLANACVDATIVEVNLRESGGGPRNGLFDDIEFETVSDPEVRKALSNAAASVKSTSNDMSADEAWYLKALLGRRVRQIHRKGKQLWWSFHPLFSTQSPSSIGSSASSSKRKKRDESPSSSSSTSTDVKVLFHFGMTGSFVIKNQPIPTYKSFKIDANADIPWPPKFTKIEIVFDNGVRVAFCDPRRLGRIRLRCDVENTSPVKDLARDPVLEPLPSPEELQAILSAYSTSIKAVLLDQEKVFCGIGNYLADEILYQAGIHPETKACDINQEGCKQLLQKMNNILVTAIAADAKYEAFPKDWLFHYRWDKVKANGGEKLKMPDGNAIHFETHGGRTSAIVSKQQPKNGYYLVKKVSQATVRKKSKVDIISNRESDELTKPPLTVRSGIRTNSSNAIEFFQEDSLTEVSGRRNRKRTATSVNDEESADSATLITQCKATRRGKVKN